MNFTKLSPEIILHIAEFCSVNETVKLSRTCRHFYRLLESEPWHHIHSHWSHGRQERMHAEDVESVNEDYDDRLKRIEAQENRRRKKETHTTQFVNACYLKHKNPASWELCSATVQSLHITLNGYLPASWNFILYFTNLEVLCVTGTWLDLRKQYYFPPDKRDPQWDEIGIPETVSFPHLKSVTLTEYVPAAWARKLLQAAPCITHLDLAMLAPPLDPPVTHWDELPRDAFPPPQFRDGVWLPTDTDEEFIGESDYEFGCDQCIALSSLPLSMSFSHLTSLTRLRLCKPAEREDRGEIDSLVHNLKLERAVLEEWADLLRAARPTLEEIVFDLRPVVREIWCDGMEPDAPVRKYSRREAGDDRFQQLVLVPVFFEDEEANEWPSLKKVRFTGVEIEDLLFEEQRGHGRRRLQEKLGPGVQVQHTLGMYSFVNEGQERIGLGYLQ